VRRKNVNKGDVTPIKRLTISSLNVRSLNISTKNETTTKKIHCLVEDGCEIVFISDLRLNSRVQNAAIHDLTKKFLMYGYDFHHNSEQSSRGVGILLKKKFNFDILGFRKDNVGNYLLLNVKLGESEFILGSIYGPNDDNMAFYDDLKNDIQNLRNENIILGGDWNATWDSRDLGENLDVLNMAGIPSARRSRKIQEIATELKMTETYRIFKPNHREYTYVPSAAGNANRSRLDFFLISETLTHLLMSCKIPPALNSLVFDHKKISISFKPEKNTGLQLSETTF